MTPRARVMLAAEAALLAAAVTVAAVIWEPDDWTPLALFAVLLGLTIGSDLMTVPTRFRYLRISGAFLAIVLAITLLGPVPAAAIGAASSLVDGAVRNVRLPEVLANVANYATFPLAAGLLIQHIALGYGLAPSDPGYLLAVFVAFAVANILNFLLNVLHLSVVNGESIGGMFRTVFIPVLLPSELPTALLAVGIVFLYAHLGVAAIALVAVVLFTFQYLLRELLISQQRAEDLETRTRELASLQVGVLTAMIQTLSLRDRMTARHCAAVARYSREIARAAGLSEAEQELVHTAGLLHDLGKFIFPDEILVGGKRLTDEQWEIVKRHPAQGARVVRKVDGYGPVADIILCHHERIDGKGYPRGLAGADIPMLARIISIADTYDVMTARDSYRTPCSPAEAIAELRRVAGTQLDAEFVEVFVGVLERKGIGFQHADDADFEAELNFETRVGSFLAPRVAAA